MHGCFLMCPNGLWLQGIIFVVDSADAKRLELAKAELNGVLLDSQLKVVSRHVCQAPACMRD